MKVDWYIVHYKELDRYSNQVRNRTQSVKTLTEVASFLTDRLQNTERYTRWFEGKVEREIITSLTKSQTKNLEKYLNRSLDEFVSNKKEIAIV